MRPDLGEGAATDCRNMCKSATWLDDEHVSTHAVITFWRSQTVDDDCRQVMKLVADHQDLW